MQDYKDLLNDFPVGVQWLVIIDYYYIYVSGLCWSFPHSLEGEHSLFKLPRVFRSLPLQEQLQAQSREALRRLVDLVKNKEKIVSTSLNLIKPDFYLIKPWVENHIYQKHKQSHSMKI